MATEAQGNSLTARLQNATQLPAAQKLTLMILIALAAAIIGGGVMWSRAPEYRVLFSQLPDRDGGAVIASLQQLNVPYRVEGGALLVPSSKLHETRLKLASQGLPKGALAGFELMENQKFGASQFLEQINYQRAMEGELARSIQLLAAVQGARVHLALSRNTPFMRDAPKSTASVLVNLYPGRTLDAAQVSAITHLVSNSVQDLPAANVSVVDQNGALLSNEAGAAGRTALDSSQIRYRHDIEAGYIRRIEAILAPIVGPKNLRAQVSAEIDFSQIEQAEETYKPNQKPEDAVVRSRQSSESSSGDGNGAGGVPGALSNQPPAAVSAPIDAKGASGAAATATTKNGNTRNDSVVNYEIDKNIRHIRQATGRVKRLSVAVVVNHKRVLDSKGKAGAKALSAEETAQITELVKGVVGYDKERGDVVSIANSPFTTPDREVIPEVPLWKQPATIEMALEAGKNLLIAAIVLYLVLGVLRPMLNRMTQSPLTLTSAREPHLLPGGGVGVSGGSTLNPDGSMAAIGVNPFDQTLQSAKELAKQDPRIVANVVKGWVGGNER